MCCATLALLVMRCMTGDGLNDLPGLATVPHMSNDCCGSGEWVAIREWLKHDLARVADNTSGEIGTTMRTSTSEVNLTLVWIRAAAPGFPDVGASLAEGARHLTQLGTDAAPWVMFQQP